MSLRKAPLQRPTGPAAAQARIRATAPAKAAAADAARFRQHGGSGLSMDWASAMELLVEDRDALLARVSERREAEAKAIAVAAPMPEPPLVINWSRTRDSYSPGSGTQAVARMGRCLRQAPLPRVPPARQAPKPAAG